MNWALQTPLPVSMTTNKQRGTNVNTTQQAPRPVFITRAEAAAILHVNPRTMTNWASAGIGPQCYTGHRPVLYVEQDVYDFVLNGSKAVA